MFLAAGHSNEEEVNVVIRPQALALSLSQNTYDKTSGDKLLALLRANGGIL